jgi:hypothetical protein
MNERYGQDEQNLEDEDKRRDDAFSADDGEEFGREAELSRLDGLQETPAEELAKFPDQGEDLRYAKPPDEPEGGA